MFKTIMISSALLLGCATNGDLEKANKQLADDHNQIEKTQKVTCVMLMQQCAIEAQIYIMSGGKLDRNQITAECESRGTQCMAYFGKKTEEHMLQKAPEKTEGEAQ